MKAIHSNKKGVKHGYFDVYSLVPNWRTSSYGASMMVSIASFLVGIFVGLVLAWIMRGWISDEGQY